MKVLVVLCAVAAVCLAKPSYAPTSYSYSTSVVSVGAPAHGPIAYAGYAPGAYALPAPVAYAAPAPAPVAYAAPAPVAYAAPAPAPVAYAAPAPAVVAAPAPAVVAAPAPVAYAAPAPAVVAAPAPAVVAAPAPVAYAAPAAVHAVAAPAVKSQYHAQNEHGEASYGHAEPGQTHNAVQDAHGNKIGSFSYVNPEGSVLRTDYVADAAGYRVASNSLPAAPIVAPIDTPEVALAKAHFYNEYNARAVHSRRRRSAVLLQTPASTTPLHAPAYVTPLTYGVSAPVAYNAPVALAAPVAYPVPGTYAAPATFAHPAPVAYAAPAAIPATLTTVVNNPGHAVSYRVD